MKLINNGCICRYAEGREILLHTRTVVQQAPDKTRGDQEAVAPYDLMHGKHRTARNTMIIELHSKGF